MSMVKTNKGDQGKFLMKAMFYETCLPENREKYCSFTLKEEDHEGYPSLKRLFLSFDDPTEYEFAIAVFGSYTHWKLLTQAAWFKPYLEAMREEQEIRLTSKAVMQIAQTATTDKGFAAARWLAEKQYKPKEAGRKTKAQKEREERIDSKVHEDVSADLARLGLKVINGK